MPATIFCSKKHRYDARRKWCTECGELNPLYSDNRVPRKLSDEPPKSDCSMFFNRISKDLRRRFKKAVLHNQTSMKQAILDFMDRYATEAGFPYDISALPGEPNATRRAVEES